MPAKTLVIGLDATDPQFLPYLRSLDGLTRSVVATPEGLTDDCIWASFQYACGPGGHGRYHWKRDASKAGKFEFCTQGEEGLQSFWEPLAQKGSKVAVFDLPKMRLTAPPNGLHLSDWLVHGRYGPHPQSSPPELAAQILQEFGPAPASPCGTRQTQFSPAELTTLLENLLLSVQRKQSAARHHLQSQEWDLFMTSFKEIHCLSHLHWPTSAELVAPLLQAIDEAIQELIRTAGSQAEVTVFSTSGMGVNINLQPLHLKLVDRLQEHLRMGLRGTVDKIFGKSKVRPLPYNESCLALRLENPSPQEQETIEQCLMQIKNGKTGQPVFQKVMHPKKLWPGSRSHRLPDLLLPLNPQSGPLEHLTSNTLGDLSGSPEAVRQGNHQGPGFCASSANLAQRLGPGDLLVEHLAQTLVLHLSQASQQG